MIVSVLKDKAISAIGAEGDKGLLLSRFWCSKLKLVKLDPTVCIKGERNGRKSKGLKSKIARLNL